MNINEIAARYRLPIGPLRRMEKAGLLVADSSGIDGAAKMRHYLASGRPLSVAQLIELARGDRALMAKLGPYRAKAKAQVSALGDIASDGLGAGFTAGLIYGAAVADPGSLETLAEWLKRTVPADGCGYHYVACRMIWDCPLERWAQTYKFLPRAIINLRSMPELAGWSSKGKGETTKFHRPERFDL